MLHPRPVQIGGSATLTGARRQEPSAGRRLIRGGFYSTPPRALHSTLYTLFTLLLLDEAQRHARASDSKAFHA